MNQPSSLLLSLILNVVSLHFLLAADDRQPIIDAPLPPAEAARTMRVPPGFQVTLFAGEPHVQQPIGFCIDDRGRLWVAEAYNYPQHGTKPGDRIVILEDADNDGHFDKRTVFYDKLNYVTGIEVGFGGAWVMSPPNFYFIPDADNDDRPDSAPQVLLDGFGNHANAHNLANGFAWGPDGWLYGTHGRTNWSMIGKPGTPDEQRIRFDGGVYRYHPVRHVWEPFADGTTNPWGIDWDDYGQAFVCNCVNPHLFHVIQGAHYEPWRNRESSKYAYERIDSIADHLHFVGTGTVQDGLGSAEEDLAGGGHAHCGTMVYLGDNWPDRYRNTVFMNNIHGRRINNDILKRQGSGYTATHGRDLMIAADPWYMGVTLCYGPDGAVFASDWSDTGECHSTRNTRRQTGRIYKIAYGQVTSQIENLAQLSDRELVQRQLHRNDWHVRHARRLLQERAAHGQSMAAVHNDLQAMFADETDVARRLRALWALYVTGGTDDAFLLQVLQENNEHLRSWAIRLLCEDGRAPAAALDRFEELSAIGDSALVRLQLTSSLPRLPTAQRWSIAEALISRGDDAADANLPLMTWYAIEPLVNADMNRFVELATIANIPLIRRHIARRAITDRPDDAGLKRLIRLLHDTSQPDRRADMLAGVLLGLAGRRSVPMPSNWPAAYERLHQDANSEVQQQALQLALIFDDPVALTLLREQAADSTRAAATRQQAIAALVANKPAQLSPLLLDLVHDPATRSAALRGLAEYDDGKTASTLLALYDSFSPADRQNALQTLASRPHWAAALLEAVDAKKIARTDLSAFTARQIENLGDESLIAKVRLLWGQVRETPADKRKLIANYKRRLTSAALRQADRSAGRALFHKTCANCHRMFGTGGKIGPAITGAQRTNLDYILENLIDPSAAVAKDYQMQILVTDSGRVITGLVVAESDQALTVQTVNDKVLVPKGEIESRKASNLSIMPDGLLKQLSFSQVRDLIGYLSSPAQVPLPTGLLDADQ